jgi:hypothetical protein
MMETSISVALSEEAQLEASTVGVAQVGSSGKTLWVEEQQC